MKAPKCLWFLLPTVFSCLTFSPLRFLFFSFMVNLLSSATISPHVLPPLLLNLCAPISPLLSFTSLPPFSFYPILPGSFFFFFFKYPSSPLVLFIALHFLYRHSSACCITPEIQPPLLLFLPSRLPFSLTSFDVWRRVGIHSADKERGDDVTADMIHQHLLWSKNTHHRAHTVSLQLHSAFVSTSTLYWDGPAFTQLGLVGTLGYMPLVHNWAASVYLDIKV